MYQKEESLFFRFKALYSLLCFTCMMMFEIVMCSSQNPSKFPNGWQGKWKGEMEIYSEGVFRQKIPMQLHILPTDSAKVFTYRIIYGTDTVAGDRPYLIRQTDQSKGWYTIDEQNSIRIESYFFGNTFTSVYEVQGNFIFDILEKRGDTLYWRLFSGSNQAVSTTGGTRQGEESIPPVKAYPVRVLQQAELRL